MQKHMAKLARRRGSGGFISLTHVVFFSFLFFSFGA
jgi:hypothetical protein